MNIDVKILTNRIFLKENLILYFNRNDLPLLTRRPNQNNDLLIRFIGILSKNYANFYSKNDYLY